MGSVTYTRYLAPIEIQRATRSGTLHVYTAWKMPMADTQSRVLRLLAVSFVHALHGR